MLEGKSNSVLVILGQGEKSGTVILRQRGEIFYRYYIVSLPFLGQVFWIIPIYQI